LLLINQHDLCFFPSVTLGLNHIINQITKTLNQNDVIGLPINGHNSLLGPWIYAQKQYCFTIVWYDSENIETILKNNNLRYFCITSVSHITGELCNDNSIKKYLSKDTKVIVDASQLYHIHPMKSLESYIDCIIWSSHKTYGPYNIAPCYISQRLQLIVNKGFIGGGTLESLSKEKITIKEFPYNFMYGSLCVPEYYAYQHSLCFLEQHIWHTISYSQIIKTIQTQLKQNPDISIISHKSSSSIVTFYHKKIHAHDIAEQCNKHNIAIRSGFLCGDIFFEHYNIPPVVRISCGYQNTPEEANNLMSILNII
jgi:cysteine desulfurase/selenocysteine lyase